MKRRAADARPSIPAGRSAAMCWPDLIIVLVLAGGVGGWAGTMTLSGALIAPGSVVVDSNVKKVQHPTGGIVGELRVRDGDRVKQGDIVVRLDDTVTRANLAIVTKGLDELDARKARLESERDGVDTVKFPAELLARAEADPDVAAACRWRAQAVRAAPQRAHRPEGAAAPADRAARRGDPRPQGAARSQGKGDQADRAREGGRPRSVEAEAGPAHQADRARARRRRGSRARPGS